MKYSVVLLVVLIGACFALECPNPSCATVGSAEGCPTSSTCRDVKRPDTTTTVLLCICDVVDSRNCTTSSSSNTAVMTCGTQQNSYCGGRVTPCPDGTYCATLSSGERACRCNNVYAVFDGSKCVVQCPSNMQYDDNLRKCTCKPGYTPDCANSPSNENCPCVVAQQTSCATITCTTPYVCATTSEGPRCVPSTNDKTFCGSNFRCPSDRFTCVDTDFGARCVCADRFGRFPYCDRPKCYSLDNTDPASPLGCWNTPNAVCVSESSNDISSDRIGYCACKTGYRGDNCDITENACSTVTCSVANTHCENGRCVCNTGFVATVQTSDNGETRITKCEAKDPPACDATRCPNNKVCVSRPNGVECVCPSETFGSFECNKPRCNADRDCAYLTNGYCVLNTVSNVAGFCSCKPGFTGEKCEVRHTCDRSDCGTNTRCDNEGVCKCEPGRDGSNCGTDKPDELCTKVTLVTRDKLTADELEAKLAEFVRVDVTNFRVLSGPEGRDNGEGYRYVVSVCRDQNVDEKRTSDDIIQRANTSEGESAGFLNAAAGDVNVDQSSTATVAAVSTAALCAAAAMTCF